MTTFNKCVLNAILLISNIGAAVRIDNLVVPELVQIGDATEVILDCQFSQVTDVGLTVQWYFNGNQVPVYQWSPGTIPTVDGILSGRLALPFYISSYPLDEGRALRIVRLGAELSGAYSCAVHWNGTNVRHTKSMLVFSPEREFDLKVTKADALKDNVYDVQCSAGGLFPLPDLMLEYNNELIPKQAQRTWRGGALYEARAAAALAAACRGAVACRLLLPEAGYVAIKEKFLYTLDSCRNVASTQSVPVAYLVVVAVRAVPLRVPHK